MRAAISSEFGLVELEHLQRIKGSTPKPLELRQKSPILTFEVVSY